MRFSVQLLARAACRLGGSRPETAQHDGAARRRSTTAQHDGAARRRSTTAQHDLASMGAGRDGAARWVG
eukprot:jgi/Ulvmu1/3241/UM150_0014.1